MENELKFYSRGIWKGTSYDFKHKTENMVFVLEYVATRDIRPFNYRKKKRFEETNSAKEFFKKNPNYKENKVYYIEQRKGW